MFEQLAYAEVAVIIFQSITLSKSKVTKHEGKV